MFISSTDSPMWEKHKDICIYMGYWFEYKVYQLVILIWFGYIRMLYVCLLVYANIIVIVMVELFKLGILVQTIIITIYNHNPI